MKPSRHRFFYDENQRKTQVDIVAGKINEFKAPEPVHDSWAFNNENEVAIWQIIMDKNATWEIPVSKQKVNRSLYFFEGDSVQINDEKISTNYVVEMDSSQKAIIQNGNEPARILLLQGKPINEPVVQYGPFVMNSENEIEQAFADFKRTQFGGWPWPETDMVHDKNRGRFAKFEDGEEIIKN